MGDNIDLGKILDVSQLRDCLISVTEATSSALKKCKNLVTLKKTLQIPLISFSVGDCPASSGRRDGKYPEVADFQHFYGPLKCK